MDLSKKESSDLVTLLKVEKKIRDNYFSKKNDCNLENLIALLDLETSLIASLNLDYQKLKHYEDFIKEKAHISEIADLPSSLSHVLDRDTYPFFRLVARMRYHQYGKEDIESAFTYPSFKNLETALLYRCLSNRLDKAQNSRTDTSNNIASALRNYRIFALIDSPKTELDILRNGLEPPNIILDDTDFLIDFYVLSKWQEDQKLNFSSESTDGDLYFPSHNGRIHLAWFYSHFEITFKEMVRQTNLHKHVQSSPYFLFLTCYTNVLVAMLEKKSRLEIYEFFLAKLKEKYEDYPWLSNWLSDCIEEVEKKLIPKIVHISTAKSVKK
ncbi:MAG TPA: hypothetical protein DCY94_02880 [Firmicutes bacterium]|nr:hypothetical protein [Bacillota bacterium]